MNESVRNLQTEFPIVPEIPAYIRPIWSELRLNYEYVGVIAEGKSGVAHRLKMVGTDTIVCLKTISEKVTDKLKRKETQESIKKEIAILRPLRHLSLPQVFRQDINAEPAYYICTYHPGMTLRQFWGTKVKLSVEQTYHFISALVNVLEYLHESGRTHCDLHPDNLMVSENVVQEGILLIDFGSGHRSTDTDPQTNDRGNRMFKGSAAEKKHNQLVQRRERFDEFKAYDFRALGQILQSSSDSLLSDALASHRDRFDELCDRLCRNDFPDWIAVRERVQWIVDPDRLLTKIKRLFTSSDGTLRRIPLPVYRSLPVGDAILAVVNTRAFQRLRGIQQLSFCDWIYPGTTHSRFEHSLGVFNCTRKALLALLQRNDFSDHFSIEEIKGCLLAALLHDVGHYPFAHVIEQYAAGRFSDDQDQQTRASISHSSFTKEIILSDQELRTEILKHWGARALEFCIDVLDHKLGVLSDLIDGPIDCDKIDYLKRDSLHAGLEYGSGLDLEQLFRQLVPLNKFSELGIRSEGVPSIEGLMILQDQMLNTVYWHRKIRGIMCMFHASLAFIIGKDPTVLIKLVAELRMCRNNFEAMNAVILKYADNTKGETKENLNILLGLHHSSASYSSIFVEVAAYRHTDRKKRDYHQTMHNLILSQVHQAISGSVPPIQWDNVSRLRKAVTEELNKEGIKCRKADVIVDVPVGKTSHSGVKVLSEDQQIVDIHEVSFINPAIFARPTAFASPIRIYVSPRIFREAGSKWVRVITAAEDRLLKHPIAGDANARF